MAPESLQSLSMAAVFVGLFFATLGGFGAFHFGRQAALAEKREHSDAVQTMGDSLALLELENRGLRERVATAEKEVSTPPPQIAVLPSPEKMPASAPTPAAPILPPASALPPIAEGPTKVEKSDPLETLSGAKPPVAKGAALGAQQRATLVKRLSVHRRHRLAIHALEGDPQALEIASALEAAFREARWEVQRVQTVTDHPPASGLTLSTNVFPPREEFVAAYSALERAGFLVTSNLDPSQTGQDVVLFVGPKH